jgi:hypothetical protein
MKQDPIVIYWAPAINLSSDTNGEEMLYPDPTNLLSDLIKNRNKNSGASSFFSCPAASGRLKRSFVFRNALRSEYHYDFTDTVNPVVIPTSKYSIPVKILRQSAMNEGASIVVGLRYIFFSNDSVMAHITPPMMHEPKYTKYGTAIPGAYDISKWFRPFVMELQMWKTAGDLVIEEDEPLFYLEVPEDRDVVLKRFKVNDTLMRYLDGCVQAPAKFGRYLPLSERYKKFTQSRMNELVLREIKKNLI